MSAYERGRTIDVAGHVAHIARLLEREIATREYNESRPEWHGWKIEQRCTVCGVFIAVSFQVFEIESVEWLFERMFELYDEHRCIVTAATAGGLRDRAERESERLARRAAAIRELESSSPATELPSLYERAERESVVLAEWAQRFATLAA